MNRSQVLSYGVLGAPLAMAALPVYIHAPKLYGDEFGLGLALTGAILLGARAVDTFQDPWLGRLTDWAHGRPQGWAWLMSLSAICLCLTYAALFNPPANNPRWLPYWFGLTMVLVYTAHSALNITYLAWGARASQDTHERTRIVAYREGFALVGVIIASTLPMLLGSVLGFDSVWMLFSLVFAVVLLPACVLILKRVPQPHYAPTKTQPMFQPLRNRPFRRLATLFTINGFAVAVAATLSLFYMQDVLQLEQYSGLFLALYFIVGAASLPIWMIIARRIGKPKAWCLGGVLAVLGFVWATQLSTGDGLAYALVCVMSGAALGADLALPASIAADIIPEQERGQAGGYFGIWSLINKAVLALAAGLALPFLALLDYQPGQTQGLTALAMVYAGVPCVIKLISIGLTLRWQTSLEVVHER